MESVLITGGSGLIGSYLSDKLLKKGYKVSHLSRFQSQRNSIRSYQWDYKSNYIDAEAIKDADFIIHLAGESLVKKRWTKQQKQLIVDSRVKTTELLFNEVTSSNKKLKAFISASGVGYYGAINSEKIANEKDNYHNDFLGLVCLEWEQSAFQFQDKGIRTVVLRTGMVLSKTGGALSKLKTSFKFGFGSALGTGKQYVSWIHIDDLCEMYIKAIEDQRMKGVYNAVAPEQITNKDFSRTIADVLQKPFWMPNVPSIVLKLMLGEMSVMLLKGIRVSSKKIENIGFKFKFTTLEQALQNLIKE